MCRERTQNLFLLPLRHFEVVERTGKFSSNFVELLGRNLELTMGFF